MPEHKEDDGDSEEECFDEQGEYFVYEDIRVPPPPAPPKYRGDENNRRLIITHIENINFKSYAGTQILGPFHKSFTAIVGPNGSGKSNVIDSMLFVFGFRASKLRLKNLISLIHKSDSYPNFKSCSVIVHFAEIEDLGDDFNLIKGSEFSVCRKVEKNSPRYDIDEEDDTTGRRGRGKSVQYTSSYKITDKNGERTAQFKQVAQLLMDHGIDLRYNRFLILQGEVEQIALMKPKAENEHDTGMLEYLEGIIGSDRLKGPINQLTSKLEKKNELRAEKMNRVRTVQKEKETLEKAKNEAVAFLEEENRLTIEKNKLYQVRKAEAKEDMADVLSEFERAKKIYEEVVNKGAEIEKDRKEGEDVLKKLQEDIKNATKKAEDSKEEFTAIERKDQQLRTKAKHSKEKGKKLNKLLDEAKDSLVALEEEPAKLNANIVECEKKIGEIESKKASEESKLTAAMEEIKSTTLNLQEQKDGLEAKIVDLQGGVNEARSNLEIAETELNFLLDKERGEKAKLEHLKAKYESNVTDLERKEKALEEYQTKIPQTESKVTVLQSELEKKESQLGEVHAELKEKSGRCNELKSTLHLSASRNAVLSFLMEQKRLGNIDGVYGRLGDLGAIDERYDIAISTACGPLDNIVTDTMDTAIKCTELLKKHNIGSATFIALDKMDRSRYQEPINTPENVPRLYDLITVNDDDVLPAFYFAIRDTLVAENLNQATRIGLGGRQRWRVVTLEGKMVEVSGAMSGGGRPSRGRMGTSVVSNEGCERDIRELENDCARLEEAYQRLKLERDELRITLKRNQEELEKMKAAKPKYEMDVEMTVNSRKQLEKLISEQEVVVSNVAPDQSKLRELQTNVDKFQKIFDEKDDKVKRIQEKVKEVNDQIEEIFEAKVGSVKKKIESLSSQFTQLSNQISKTAVALKMNSRNVEKAKEKIKNIEDEIEASKKLIEDSAAEMKKLEEDGKIACEKYQQELKAKEELEEKYKEESQSVKKLEGKEMKLKAEIMDAKNELDSQEAIVNDKSGHVNHWQAKIDELKLNEIEGKQLDAQLPVLSDEELEELSVKAIEKEIESIKKTLSTMKPNMGAIAEFKKKEQIWLERVKELEEVTAERNEIKDKLDELKTKRLDEFKQGYFTISRKLKEIYRALTSGGDAGLEYADSLDPFSEGIEFTVRPNKKTWKRITNLSGGEKTLSSLALIFAVHHFKPSPLYVMDEIDAALDFKNVSLVGNYVKQKTRNTQFLIISLRYNMYELADRLVGIYKTHNATKSVTLDPAQVSNISISTSA